MAVFPFLILLTVLCLSVLSHVTRLLIPQMLVGFASGQ
jgi:hypothetical protein